MKFANVLPSEPMTRNACLVAVLIASVLGAAPALAADNDPLARARLLYNEHKWEASVAAADQARANPSRADSADLIAARALLERFRESAGAMDLTNARERLRRVDPRRFGPRERLEYIVGLGETLYFDGSYGSAASVFDSVLAPASAVPAGERERVLDWWASALDRDARPRSEFDRQAVYQRVRDRMYAELASVPNSSVAVYWLCAAARGQGDLQGAWNAAQAGWVRAPLAGDGGDRLRLDLDLLVTSALIPERARVLGQPPAAIRAEWDRFKERWAADLP